MSVLFILLMHLVNGAEFLNVTSLFLSSARLAAASSPAPVIFHFIILILHEIFSLLISRY